MWDSGAADAALDLYNPERSDGGSALGSSLNPDQTTPLLGQIWTIPVDISRQGHIFTIWSIALACTAILRNKVGSCDDAGSRLDAPRLVPERAEDLGRLADVLDDLARRHHSTGRLESVARNARDAIDAYQQAGDAGSGTGRARVPLVRPRSKPADRERSLIDSNTLARHRPAPHSDRGPGRAKLCRRLAGSRPPIVVAPAVRTSGRR
jgi:hypothetical protein